MSHLTPSKLLSSGGWLLALIMVIVLLCLWVSDQIKTYQLSLKPKPPTPIASTSSTTPVKCTDMCINGYVYLVFSYSEGPYQTAPIAITPVYDQITKPQALIPRKCPKGLECDKGSEHAK